ncbi:hypothetical protein GFH30_01620 [Acinetobacter wanghuae]|uniref:Uncharacterized protein n=1 Tax=Acinetobacter wanghuae TaxID=2662362 RepID=A0A5Q0P0E9_9GAMM|nr:hypothetical protein [Acinetobacter wanghuae]MQW91002.1 hypothetical protein [Acinetobacter wanghuae]QGA10172.1 hypothetical protein GFH30_01620 [Acinetobacter wanghuae]
MKLKALLLTGLAGIALTACTSAPTIPQVEAGVIQAVQNLDVYPQTTNNKAKLTKFADKCVIEFSGTMQDSRVVEQWAFKGLTIMDAGSATFLRDGTSSAQKFDLYDAEVQKNFVALRNAFAKEAVAQCD